MEEAKDYHLMPERHQNINISQFLQTFHRDLVDEAKDYHLMPERRPQLQSQRTKPRSCNDITGLIYAVGGLTRAGMLALYVIR